jgi:spore coat polysaccharide biosynthesis predicted glycosyltransferase SpsG
MKPSADLRVLFRAPAGARRGFGHLVRCISLARAMGVRPLIAVRGSRKAMEVGLALGADVMPSATSRTIARVRPDVVVIDDPSAAHAQRWIAAARRAGALVVTVHDLGVGCPDGDVVVDGSITARHSRNHAPRRDEHPASSGGTHARVSATHAARGRKVSLTGTRFAILDSQYSTKKRSATVTKNKQILIALGGGPHATMAAALARAIVAADPEAQVRIAGGFVAPPRPVAPRVTWVAARRGLGQELASADVAVVGGGVSLYEACAMGVPTVALPVANGQVPTVRAFAKRGAAVGLGRGAAITKAATEAVALLNNPHQRKALRRHSMRLVDGLGASRAAAAVAALSQGN